MGRFFHLASGSDTQREGAALTRRPDNLDQRLAAISSQVAQLTEQLQRMETKVNARLDDLPRRVELETLRACFDVVREGHRTIALLSGGDSALLDLASELSEILAAEASAHLSEHDPRENDG